MVAARHGAEPQHVLDDGVLMEPAPPARMTGKVLGDRKRPRGVVAAVLVATYNAVVQDADRPVGHAMKTERRRRVRGRTDRQPARCCNELAHVALKPRGVCHIRCRGCAQQKVAQLAVGNVHQACSEVLQARRQGTQLGANVQLRPDRTTQHGWIGRRHAARVCERLAYRNILHTQRAVQAAHGVRKGLGMRA